MTSFMLTIATENVSIKFQNKKKNKNLKKFLKFHFFFKIQNFHIISNFQKFHTGAKGGAETSYPYEIPAFTPGF